METPSSARRVTRSTTRKLEESESKSKQRNTSGKPQFDRTPLIDITNDSPIVGLAFGGMGTPSSAMSKKRFTCPGSGEALLRGQVKNLLQKVEEEAELSKLTVEKRPSLQVKGFIHSPMAFAAPTPANTPQIFSLSANAHPMEEEFVISKVAEISESNLMITRSLMDEFSEKSEGSICSSEVTIQEAESSSKESVISGEDDDMSLWSIQVNVSAKDEEEDEEEYDVVRCVSDDEVDQYADDDYVDEQEDEGGVVDDLCAAMSQINVNGAGKHTRFVYNSDDELEAEVVEDGGVKAAAQPLNLRGLPEPKGKHLRFPDD